MNEAGASPKRGGSRILIPALAGLGLAMEAVPLVVTALDYSHIIHVRLAGRGYASPLDAILAWTALGGIPFNIILFFRIRKAWPTCRWLTGSAILCAPVYIAVRILYALSTMC